MLLGYSSNQEQCYHLILELEIYIKCFIFLKFLVISYHTLGGNPNKNQAQHTSCGVRQGSTILYCVPVTALSMSKYDCQKQNNKTVKEL